MIVMAFDGIFLHSIVSELRKELIGKKIDKINQPEKDEIVLTIRGSNFNKKLLISSSSNYPRLHFTNYNKQNPMKAPMYCMVLRKYLTNSKIVDIRQIATDRIINIDVEGSDELGFNSAYSLVIEIMGKHSNITLLRQRDNVIMDCIKHITPDINSYRSLYPGIKYISPPPSNKLNPFEFIEEDLIKYIRAYEIKLNENMFYNIFTGVSKILSKEIYRRLLNNCINIDIFEIGKLSAFIKVFLESLKRGPYEFAIYSDKSSFKDFYCVKLDIMNQYNELIYDNPYEMLETFYFEKDKADRLNSKSSDLQKLINNNLDRCEKKADILNDTLLECRHKDLYKLQGELLTANIYRIKKGDKKAVVSNYYSEDMEEMVIKLDENKSPSENIQYYFKRYNKLKKSEESSKEQLKTNAEEMEYLQSVLTNIKNVDNYEEIEGIRNELIEVGYIKNKKRQKDKKSKISKPLHFKSSEGIDIYIGKNNIQNDYLTLKFADKHDIWLHTKNIPGSHVIIKNSQGILDKTLEEAAILAAYYSKAKDSSKVPVDYTEVKNVKKPSGSKPGMVIYYTNKTVYVDPYDIQLTKV
jgi:predicted ribosome quality control (RQC) complex YloA/Tae2 family protein